jgi:hypothetical protein
MSLHLIKGTKSAPKASRSTMETVIVTIEQVNAWRSPPFQRPVRINAKVQIIAEEMKCEGTSIPGIITLGKLTGDNVYYVVDGQHRCEAFRMSGLPEAIADLRVVHFDSMAEMADEYVQLNTAIVRMRPDDLIRGLVPGLPHLKRVMDECPFIGYGNVRRGEGVGPVVSIAGAIRCWHASSNETPTNSPGSINTIAMALDGDSADKLIRFMHLAVAAWGRDPEYYRLWGSLNVALCMWLYRRVVLDTNRRAVARVAVLTDAQFKSAMTALSADSNYLDWLPGRLLNDRDRSPALVRIKHIFSRRLADNFPGKLHLPQPAWASK